MRDNLQQQKPVSFAATMQAGFASSVLTFAIRWLPDCVVNRKIVDSKVVNTGKSFFNIGIAWDLAYRIPAGTVSFPAQYHLNAYCWQRVDEAHHTQSKKIAMQAAAGWAVSVVEAGIFYPFDSMRTVAQTKSQVFEGRSVHYFLHHQSQLYRGLSVVLVRNSITNIAGWGAKAATEITLEKTTIPMAWQTMFAALVFGVTRVVIAYPFVTTNTLIQADTERRVAVSMQEKFNYVFAMISKRSKEKGFRSFYEGFYVKGGAQIFTTALQMWLFSWWIHPERKPLNASSFFLAAKQMQFFPQGKKKCGNNPRLGS